MSTSTEGCGDCRAGDMPVDKSQRTGGLPPALELPEDGQFTVTTTPWACRIVFFEKARGQTGDIDARSLSLSKTRKSSCIWACGYCGLLVCEQSKRWGEA